MAEILRDIKGGRGTLENALEDWHRMLIPEAVLFKIRVEVFFFKNWARFHIPQGAQVNAQRNWSQSLSVGCADLPPTAQAGGQRSRLLRGSCQMLLNRGSWIPLNALPWKDSCKFLCGCVFRTATKNSRGPFPQLSGSYVEVGLLTVKYGTTWI